MARKTGLGDVLGSIFDDEVNLFGEDASSGNNAAITTLRISAVEPNRDQPRKDFDPEKLNLLAESIAEHGIIQPLTVRPYGDAYQIVAGERRWRAARIAGLSEVPVRIMELTDVETMQIALIENLQREDLNPLEEAMGYQELIERFEMKQEEVARKVGKARSSVTNALRLLAMPDEVKSLVRDGEISKGHCKALMGAASDSQMIELAGRVIREGLSVRALEKLIKAANQEKLREIIPQRRNTFYVEAELSLANTIGKPVRVVEGKNKITLEIDVASEEELREVVNSLGDGLRN